MATTTPLAAGDAGSGSGDLYGDLWVLLRDLDPAGGGGDGEPVLDANGQLIPVGLDTTTGDIFPIYFVEGTEGDYEIPPDLLPYVQEIVLERVNVARASPGVIADALTEALAKIENGTAITTDAAGRIVVDGVTIDSPRENIALYKFILTEGGSTGWTDVLNHATTNLPAKIADLLDSGWDPTGLLGGAVSKSAPFSMDAVLTVNTFLGVNTVTGSGATAVTDYFDFHNGSNETFDYDRVARYGDTWIKWYQDMDGDPNDLEAVQRTVLDAVWGTDNDGDGVNDIGSGVNWVDEYIKLSADGLSFETFAATKAGVNDWAQAVDDSRAVINFTHEAVGSSQVGPPPSTNDTIDGYSSPDYLVGWGGNDLIRGFQGNDWIEGNDGKDRLGGGWGADTLLGGEGGDRFIFLNADLGSTDVIVDFSRSSPSTYYRDLIDLARVDADTTTLGDAAFDFIGYADFSGTAGELRAVDLGGTQRIEGDVNGDGVAELVIEVWGTVPAEASWFAL